MRVTAPVKVLNRGAVVKVIIIIWHRTANGLILGESFFP
jgi:hypothetical protein